MGAAGWANAKSPGITRPPSASTSSRSARAISPYMPRSANTASPRRCPSANAASAVGIDENELVSVASPAKNTFID